MAEQPLQDSTSRFERHGWRGIGVPVEAAGREFHHESWLAVTNDPDTLQPAVSVWYPDGPGASRAIAFWMTPEGARALALALLARAEEAER